MNAVTVVAPERLRANLARQVSTATELEVVLGSEREQLITRNWDVVLRLSADKNRLVQQLQSLGRELDEITAGRDLQAVLVEQGLKDACAALHDQAARLQRANREVRALLDHHQTRVGTALRLLGRGDAAGTYGRNGYTGTGRVSQRLAAA
ncbi:MAG: flagellar export chaperone FlgN [Panacagrimonas sp.]